MTVATIPQIHIRYDGQSFDIALNELDVGVLSSDQEVRNAVANHMHVPLVKLNNFMIDRNHESNELTLRPNAVFG